MKQWAAAWVTAILSCVVVLAHHASSGSLLEDSDTIGILKGIAQRGDVWSWFRTDWPLENHFYRPLATVSFALDQHLYGQLAAGYGWTNATLCAASVLGLAWFLREVTNRKDLTVLGTALFTSWIIDGFGVLARALTLVAVVTLLVGIYRHRTHVKHYLVACLALLFVRPEVLGLRSLYFRTEAWLPGRTATLMTVFALVGMAAYARYERLSAQHSASAKPTPLDPPATRTSRQTSERKARAPWVWALVSVLMVAAALATYEQAVMLPAALVGVAVSLRLQGFRPRWGWQAPFWALLIGYLALRYQIIPHGESPYQAQQMRTSSTGVLLTLAGYALPLGTSIPEFRAALSLDPLAWIAPLLGAPLGMWGFPYAVAQNISAFIVAKRQWIACLTGWALSCLAYLPMAFVKEFDHYHFWPMALRSLMVAGLLIALKDAVFSAWSPRVLQAPKRSAPAPGSLPHP